MVFIDAHTQYSDRSTCHITVCSNVMHFFWKAYSVDCTPEDEEEDDCNKLSMSIVANTR